MQDFKDVYKEIGDGWLPIVQKLHQDLLKIAPGYEVCQIKEKFGGLRYYTTPICDEGQKLIDEAEKACTKICEFCASTDEVETKGPNWLKTFCKACHEKREADRRGK